MRRNKNPSRSSSRTWMSRLLWESKGFKTLYMLPPEKHRTTRDFVSHPLHYPRIIVRCTVPSRLKSRAL